MRLRDTALAPVLLALVAAATVWASTLAWRSFTTDPGGYLQPMTLLATVVAVSGLLARAARLPTAVVLVAQLVLGIAAVSLLLTGSPLPVGGAATELRAAVDTGLDTAARLKPPVPVAGGIEPLLLGGGLACLLLVDLLACSLRRPALAGMPLLAIFAVPFSVVDDPVPWWCFVLTAAGFLTMLVLQQSERVRRWGERLDPPTLTGRGRLGMGAGTVGSVATVLALVVPGAVPTLDVHLLGFGPGSGGGNKITVTNPLVGLKQELTRGRDVALVQITTADPDPRYLRVAALARFGDNEWSAGDRDVPARNDADGRLPNPQGLAPWLERVEHAYDVSVFDGFESRWLPTQNPITEIEAEGDWRYDTSTMDFLAGDGQSAAGMDYTFTALEVTLQAADLRDAAVGAGSVPAIFRDLPDDFPREARDLARSVTEHAGSPFAKAVALQDWFREDGGFTYDDDVPLRSSPDDLVQFLTPGTGGRTGFCQQFATAMAAMARALGIPARVAVGFLIPDEVAPNTYVYSAHDMHAWPELYFSGAGWVRFEPTPAARAEQVPAYTRNINAERPDAPTTSAAPSAAASSGPSAAPRPETQQTDDASGGEVAGDAWWWALVSALVLLVVMALLMLPGRIRRRRRAERLAEASPESVWLELRDTVVDIGLPWPESRSPRETGERLATYVGHGEAEQALLRLVALLELERYSPRPAALVPVADAEAILAALTTGLSGRTRRRAAWWPRSVLSRQPSPAAVDADERLARELVDSVN